MCLGHLVLKYTERDRHVVQLPAGSCDVFGNGGRFGTVSVIETTKSNKEVKKKRIMYAMETFNENKSNGNGGCFGNVSVNETADSNANLKRPLL